MEQAEDELGGRRGGYLTIVHPEHNSGNPIQIAIGDIHVTKRRKYQDFSLEKITRVLALRANGQTDQVTSAQSRNPEAGQWGGAIYSIWSDVGYSFSGLPEAADHGLMIALAHHIEGWQTGRARRYFDIFPESTKWWVILHKHMLES
ncbi:hypothetical protein KJ910_03685 [Patescibacteria group bacterium]|nr:hypothetical protein [Patescibacteria group bacterium]MBU1907136.1 hypothetical protein [Patescibacteria group bacterium]